MNSTNPKPINNFRLQTPPHMNPQKQHTLPKGWEVKRLGDIAVNGTQNGMYKEPKFYGSGFEMVHMTDIFRSEKIINGETFCFETVFSHESKLELIKKAKSNGYQVVLVFIHLDSPERNIARVFQRVENGGHNVPYDRIKNRITRALENLKKAIPLVDKVALVDNSSTEDPLKMVAKISDCKVTEQVNPLPKWAAEIINSI